jgi:Protein of unknown function (DUF2384)
VREGGLDENGAVDWEFRSSHVMTDPTSRNRLTALGAQSLNLDKRMKLSYFTPSMESLIMTALKLVTAKQSPTATITPDMVAAGLRAFFQIVDKWQIPNEQAMVLLGQPAKSTFFKWRKGEVKGKASAVDLVTRISYVLGIFEALEVIYQRPDHADRWVTQPNLALGGQSALERMMGGQITDLAAVRDYLDSVRGGW